MTDLYVQNIENPLSKSARKKQIAGVLFTLLGIGLIIVATAVSYYAFIGVGVLLALGTYLTVSYNIHYCVGAFVMACIYCDGACCGIAR